MALCLKHATSRKINMQLGSASERYIGSAVSCWQLWYEAMEALAALSAACNILQLVETGSQVASCLRQVYKDGNTKHSFDLNDVSQSLSESLKDFELIKIDRFKDDERELYILGCQVAAVPGSLHSLVQTSTQYAQMRTRDKLKNTLRTMRAKGEVEECEAKLRLFQNTLNTTILLNLR